MKTFTISITGSGTREEILNSLKEITDSIRMYPIDELDGVEWEDSILMTIISEEE
jgi:hypothetical protein